MPSCSRNSWSHRNMVGILCTTTTPCLLLKYPLIRAPLIMHHHHHTERERERSNITKVLLCEEANVAFALLNINWSTQNNDYNF